MKLPYKPIDGIYLDIETVRIDNNYNELPEVFKDALDYDFEREGNSSTVENYYYNVVGGLRPEYSRIVAISVGVFDRSGRFMVKCFNEEDERDLLMDFMASMKKLRGGRVFLCGHAIKIFDFPFIVKRSIINDVELHEWFDTYGKKPWDLNYLVDTKEMWKGIGIKGASLITLCANLKVPSPKGDIKGSEVGTTYWEEKDGLERVSKYCNRDVIATARCYQRMGRLPMFTDDVIKEVQ